MKKKGAAAAAAAAIVSKDRRVKANEKQRKSRSVQERFIRFFRAQLRELALIDSIFFIRANDASI